MLTSEHGKNVFRVKRRIVLAVLMLSLNLMLPCACGSQDSGVIADTCEGAKCPPGTLLTSWDGPAEGCRAGETLSFPLSGSEVSGRCFEKDGCVFLCSPPSCCGDETWTDSSYECSQDCCADGSAPPCPSVCGDGECSGNEDFSVCPWDCKCVPKCEDRQCGEDGCDGTCGQCPDPWKDICHARCQDGKCVPLQLDVEICDGKDNDCDGEVDEGLSLMELHVDLDGDGFGAETSPPVSVCVSDVDGDGAMDVPVGFSEDGTDCNDAFSVTFPGAPELCDGILNDCLATYADYQCPTVCQGVWPVAAGATFGTVVAAQLDNDNMLEVVHLGESMARVLDHLGNVQWEVNADVIYSQPVLADLNEDSVLDLVVAEDNSVRVLSGIDGTELESYAVQSSGARPACVHDLDGDGTTDIVAPANGVLSIILRNGDGTAKEIVEVLPPADGVFAGNVASALDVDGDGVAEVVVPTGYGTCNTPGNPSCHGYLLIVDPLTGDFKFDPEEQFVVPSAQSSFAGGSRPVIGDADGNGVAEIMVWFGQHGSQGELLAWNLDGTMVEPPLPFNDVKVPQLAPLLPDGSPNLAMQLPLEVGGAVADLDGDGIWEIIKSQKESHYLIVERGGEVMDGYPVMTEASTPVVTDLDLDGAMEVLFIGSSNGAVNCLTLGPGTWSPDRLLRLGSEQGLAVGRYRTGNMDPYEPNDIRTVPFAASESTAPILDSRAFPLHGMVESHSSSEGLQRRITALIGTKGDRDFYWVMGTKVHVVLDELTGVLEFDLLVHVYHVDGANYVYLATLSGTAEGEDEVVCSAAAPCDAAGTGGTRLFVIEIAPAEESVDWGLWPYSLSVDWAW